jgi:hypothetical protein
MAMAGQFLSLTFASGLVLCVYPRRYLCSLRLQQTAENMTVIIIIISMVHHHSTISHEITQAGKRAFWWFGGV